jgi:hypothetical protein
MKIIHTILPVAGLIAFLHFPISGNAQSTTEGNEKNVYKAYDISAEAHAFMCPFLSPKYMQRIHSLDSCKVWRTDDLVIHVEFSKPTTVNEEQLLLAAEKTGYERKNITVRETTK